MALLFRVLRSRPGREAAVQDWLRQYASRLLQDGETSLLICGTDDPGEFVWLGHQAETRRPPLGARDWTSALGGPLLEPTPVVALRFVGGWHRLPAPPYQIWNVELRVPEHLAVDSITELLTPPGGPVGDQLVGRSVFRMVEEPTVFVGFVALTWSWLRQHPVPRRTDNSARGAVAVWRPVSPIYRAEAVRGSVEGSALGSLWSGLAPAPAYSCVSLSS